MVCSKAVAATILGCQQTADLQYAALELTLSLPIKTATARMDVPYDYYLLGVPNCPFAASYVNSNMGAEIPVAGGGFSSVRAEVRADCLNATDLRIRVLSIH